MKIPFVDLKAQYKAIRQSIDPAIQGVLDDTAFIQGRAVREFEEKFAQEHGVGYCLGVGSGTAALHLALWALGIGAGDEVITVSHSFVATAEGIFLAGAKPVFIDIDPVSYTINPRKLEGAITPRTKAVIPVHLYGQAADMAPILEISRKHNLQVIEDAAQAHFVEYKGKRIGGLGTVGCFSFYPSKNLGAYGEAGAVVTNDRETAETIARLRDHGETRKYYHARFGQNYRMDNLQGAVLGAKLPFLGKWTEARRKNAEIYTKFLAGLDGVIPPRVMDYSNHVFHLYVLKVPKRDELKKFLEEKGIGTGIHYPVPIHLQDACGNLGYRRGDLPLTEDTADSILSLPMYPELTKEQIRYVADSIREFYC